MKNIFLFILILFFLASCKSGSDGFKLKKKSSADEFLVEKKSPLALPPEYGKLPIPDNNEMIDGQTEKKIKSLNVDESTNSSVKIENNSKSSSIEKTILKKIK